MMRTLAPCPLLPRLALLLVLARAATAYAQPAAPAGAGEEQRTALYREGVALAESGRWPEALAKFEQVVRIRSAPPALLALGTAQVHVGQLVAAKHTLEQALAAARAAGTGSGAAIADKAAAALAALEPRLSRLIVRIPSGVSDARVSVDGAAVDPPAGGLEVDPGRHELAVTAPGHAPLQLTFVAAEGQATEIVAPLVATGSADTATTGAPSTRPAVGTIEAAAAPPPPRAGRAARWILAGGGGAALIAGGVIAFQARSDYDSASKQCPTAGTCPTTGTAAAGNSARNRILGGEIVAGAGALAVGAAAFWWIWNGTHPTPSERQVTLGAALGDGRAWLSATARF
jgi:hypothetical protein